ncbi:DsbA family oxidoreductase [Amycolatopsis sp. cmx-11-32]|uniref:DsbA family oxidoreductase n=1 Tax=Amycolatopsis sp. cmx-11-32 TaxID=2785796 RepID=UPI0039E3A0CE
MSDHAVLRELAAGVGLPAEDVDDVLGSTRYAAEVRADERTAREVGVTAVPSYRLGDRRAVSGALDVDRLVTLLREARQPTAG